jgi:aminoglycoside phosphotransferase (APT) family kinase protein
MNMQSAYHEQEETLTGGRLTQGVVRIGDTVRRPATDASGFIGRLLNHLESAGFAGAPKYLGKDEQGRDTLSYISGWVPAKFQYFNDDQILDAGRLLREFHDATRGSALVSGVSVVCHHDVGPNNAVFQNEHPVAFIDFDMAAPGPALDDVGFMAWTWCVSSKHERAPAARQARQVRLLADAYGLQSGERVEVFDAMLERQRRNVQFWLERLDARNAMLTTSEAQVFDRVEWSKRELQYTESKRLLFLEALR